MTTIARVVAVPAAGAGYYDDLAALQAGQMPLPQRFTAAPVTPGFRAVREVAEAVSIGLILDDVSAASGHGGPVAWGDCVAMAHGAGTGREPVFRTQAGMATIERTIAPVLQGRELTGFREMAAEVDALTEVREVSRTLPGPTPGQAEGLSRRALLTAPMRILQAGQQDEDMPAEWTTEERKLHSAVRYGVSQALLRAVALARGVTMTEVLAAEWDLPVPDTSVPIHAQSGTERHYHAEKMIVRRVASLPHAIVDDVPEQVGRDGSEMTRYIRWLNERIGQLGGEAYCPTIHLHLHGSLGRIYEQQLGRILGQVYAWELAAGPYPLRIESPVVLDSREAQIEAMSKLREYIRLRGMKVQLVADEWANTLNDIHAFVEAQAADMVQIKMPALGSIHNSVDAVLACKAGRIGAFLGGSYAETDLSARVSVHVALATQPDLLLARPGIGVDEAISLVQNEMERTLAQLQMRG